MSTDLEIEYSQWNLSQRLLQLVQGSKAQGEMKNCLEQWIIAMCNSDASSSLEKKEVKSWATVYHDLPRDHPIHLKLETSLREKNRNLGEGDISLLVDQIVEMVHQTVSSPTAPKLPYISEDVTRIQKVPLPVYYEETSRLLALPSILGIDKEEVLKMAMRQQTLFDGGQQLGFTQAHFDRIHRWGVTIEGFCSLFNSRLLGKEGCSVITLDGIASPGKPATAHTQSMSGDRGFFGNWEDTLLLPQWKADAKKYKMQINPPFLEGILKRAADKAVKLITLAQEYKVDFKILFHAPNWKDAEFHSTLMKLTSECPGAMTIGPANLVAGCYRLEKPNGETFIPRVDNLYYCLSSVPISAEEYLEITDLLSSPKKL
jgi:hypothetical protein